MNTFIFPSVERVTSGFRTKDRPNHHGVDFAEKGVHYIKAVADGKVTRSGVSTSYGEVVYIEHKINGEIWESVYAHMQKNSRKVKLGQTVKQGQEIGIMGNTGDSNGQHLHFELHNGKWNMDKTKAVNPLDYLGKNLTPSQTVNKPTVIKTNNQTPVYYLVKPNDTLSHIAVRYKTTVSNLVKLNPTIKNPNMIYPNQKIRIR